MNTDYTSTNAPYSGWGCLLVFNSYTNNNLIVQIFFPLSQDYFYIRSDNGLNNGAVWISWCRISEPTISFSNPSGGTNGDIWFKYS